MKASCLAVVAEEPSQATRVGAPMARLVQRRVLFDVVVNDFAAVASNAKRRPDDAIIDLFRALIRSPYEEVRSQARDIHESVEQMHRTVQALLSDARDLALHSGRDAVSARDVRKVDELAAEDGYSARPLPSREAMLEMARVVTASYA